jgi:hypothetical protein
MENRRHGEPEAGPGHRLWLVPWRTVIITVIIVFAAVQFLNFTGFCYSEGHYLSDSNLVDLATNAHVGQLNAAHKRGLALSLNTGFHEDPACCSVHRWGHWSLPEGLWVRLFGRFRAVVENLADHA